MFCIDKLLDRSRCSRSTAQTLPICIRSRKEPTLISQPRRAMLPQRLRDFGRTIHRETRMARQVHDKDISATLDAASEWINRCLIGDESIFAKDLWQLSIAREVQQAFDDHPDFGDDDFMTKLRGQMKSASPSAQRLMAEI